jgi:alpha-1,3-rhamnosyl/mannosyltransferase
MLIGIEASSAVERTRSGVGNYTSHLIAGLQQLGDRGIELGIVLFSNRDDQAGPTDCAGTSIPIYGRDRLPLRMLWMQLGLPRSINRLRPELCHFPNHLAPVLRTVEVPYVVTMHDMSVYRCPEYHPLKTVAVHRSIIPAVARGARVIVTVSESARQDIIGALNVPEDRVRVVHEGIGRRFLGPRCDRTIEEMRERYALQFPFVLSVGTVEPRKNHCGLIRAFAQLVQQERVPHHLVIVGPRGWKETALLEVVRRCGVADRIHFLGYVPEMDLPALYHAADAFAFPSWYEGFGLPVLEALACGAPTLISHDPALCEVAGAGTTLIADPGSVEDMAAGLHRLLSDATVRSRLRVLGRIRAGQFSWERCAEETYAVYREALGSRVGAARRIFRGV